VPPPRKHRHWYHRAFALKHKHGRVVTPRARPLAPPAEWAEFVQAHDACEAIQSSPDELPAIDIHSL